MSFDWSGRTPTRINVVFWPISEQIDSGRERTRWTIQTLDDLSVAELEARLTRFPAVPSASGMDVNVEVVASDELLMICEYGSSIPEPMRLGAASTTWRFLDEKLARLWMIGGQPRSHFPEFMRQRRAQLDALPEMQRLYLMFVSISRIEPLIAAAGAISEPSRPLVEYFAHEKDTRAALRALNDMTSRLTANFGERTSRRVSGEPKKADLGALLIELSELAAQALKSRATNDVARCVEEVFDILYLFDRHYGGANYLLARREDRDFRDDVQALSVGGTSDPETILPRSIQSADSVRSIVVRVDVRQQLMDAILGVG